MVCQRLESPGGYYQGHTIIHTYIHTYNHTYIHTVAMQQNDVTVILLSSDMATCKCLIPPFNLKAVLECKNRLLLKVMASPAFS